MIQFNVINLLKSNQKHQHCYQTTTLQNSCTPEIKIAVCVLAFVPEESHFIGRVPADANMDGYYNMNSVLCLT